MSREEPKENGPKARRPREIGSGPGACKVSSRPWPSSFIGPCSVRISPPSRPGLRSIAAPVAGEPEPILRQNRIASVLNLGGGRCGTLGIDTRSKRPRNRGRIL